MTGVTLGIDSATPYLALTLWSSEHGELASLAEDIGRDHARRIVPAIDDLLKRAGITPSSIEGIGVGIGPGSYVGVRVGIASATGLARAWGVPLAGAATLGALALRGLQPGERGVAILDARRGNVYAAAFERPQGPDEARLVSLSGPQKLPRDALHLRFGADAEHLFEGLPPDARYTAAAVSEHMPAVALYL